jgi:hypothetical protein
MRRRLDLASSLLTRPRVLFLDEPTTGLDPRSRNEIWEIVRDLRRDGTTILLTTQYLEEADLLADEIAVIDHGRVIAEGTGSELKDRVGGQILEVELTDVRQRDEAEAALLRVGCGAPEQDGRPTRLTLSAPREGLVLVEEAAAELRHAAIGVSDMGLRGPTLDDVFLQLTGQPSTETAAPQPAVAAPPEMLDGAGRRPRPPAPSLEGARASVTDSAVVTRRNLRHFWRQPDLLVFSTIQPIMFVVLFVYVFGGAVSRSLPPGVSYVDYLLPGIFVQSVTFRASNTAVGLSEDLNCGVIDRFRSMPMARSAVLVGRTTADLVRNVMIVALMVVVGYLVGFRFEAGVVPALACVALVAAFGFALSVLGPHRRCVGLLEDRAHQRGDHGLGRLGDPGQQVPHVVGAADSQGQPFLRGGVVVGSLWARAVRPVAGLGRCRAGGVRWWRAARGRRWCCRASTATGRVPSGRRYLGARGAGAGRGRGRPGRTFGLVRLCA